MSGAFHFSSASLAPASKRIPWDPFPPFPSSARPLQVAAEAAGEADLPLAAGRSTGWGARALLMDKIICFSLSFFFVAPRNETMFLDSTESLQSPLSCCWESEGPTGPSLKKWPPPSSNLS